VSFEVQGHAGPQRAETTFVYRPPAHKVTVHVTDTQGQPVDARVFVIQNGKLFSHGRVSRDADDKGRDRETTTVFATAGRAQFSLPKGSYRIHAVRGVRDEVAGTKVQIREDTTVQLEIPRAVDLPDHRTGDLHVHTIRSTDASITHRSRMASLSAADLDFAVITDHNTPWDARKLNQAGFEAAKPVELVPGVELNIDGEGKEGPLGHINSFPQISPVALESGPTAKVARHLDQLRQQHRDASEALGGPHILQMNHPRGIQFKLKSEVVPGSHAMFTKLGFDRQHPVGQGPNAWMHGRQGDSKTRAIDFDALEVMNRFSWPIYRSVRRDWYALWRQGYTITGTGNSDSHAVHIEIAGLPTNLVDVSAYPDAAPVDAFLQGIAEGRVLVSTGPVVSLELVCGDQRGRPGDVLHGPCETWQAEVRLQAASWVPTRVVRLLVDGKTVEKVTLDEDGNAIDQRWTWPLTIDQDAFVTAEAGWPLQDDMPDIPGIYRFVAPGYVPTGFTNPVRVDADGDGEWVPPGLF
jgi:hypothetical protein